MTSRLITALLVTTLLLISAVSVLAAPLPLAASAPPSEAQSTAPEGAWPLDPRPSVVASFDLPDDAWGAGHRGVDLAGSPGQVVRSALPGTVGFTGTIAGKPVVTVLHGARRTTYEPVVATVERGDDVAAGDPIGRLVLPGGHCFPAACLHWGLRRGEDYLDPLSLVGGGPVRLLPLWRDEPAAADPALLPGLFWMSVLSAWHRPLDALSETPSIRRGDEPVGRPDAGGRW